MIAILLFGSVLVGQGIGYSKLYVAHIFFLLSLIKDFKVSKFVEFCKNEKALVFMVLYSALSILWSASVSVGLKEVASITMGVGIVFFVGYSDAPLKKFLNVLQVVMWANLFICGGESLSLFRYPYSMHSSLAPYLGRSFIGLSDTVPTGFHFNPNNNALFILIFSPIMLSIVRKWWGAFYLVIASLVIFMATSKLILVAWILFLLVIFLGTLLKKIGPIKSILGLIGAGLLASSLFYFSSGIRLEKYRKTIPSIITFSKEAPALLLERLRGNEVKIEYMKVDISLHERLLLLDGIAKVLSEKWIWGAGGGSLEGVTHTQEGRTLTLKTPHFYFLEVWAKYGIIFLAVYLYWLGKVFRNVAKENMLFGFSLILFVIFSPVVSSVTYFLPKWGLYALLVKIIRVSKKT